MARQVFFSFHYQRDIFRVNVVRHHWLTKPNSASSGYWDHSLWESARRTGDEGIKRMIENGLSGSSVTAILIGYQTAGRRWINYEIRRSHELGKGIIGIYINKIKIPDGTTDPRGRNPLDDFYATRNGQQVKYSSIYRTYDWVDNDGYNNFADWVEAAAKQAGRQ